MALLTLRDIGKIYVSQGNVAVGIRGVNLSFERGEFVAVTGKSGSGKSTLLNIISGMDSYEEGELEIEGKPTSHYLQPDWELYREKYISFIFQDYNIIESYTVLQNVELALMHIPDKRERRRRAVDLLTRVGMASHLRQKGSKLSGGQKQRTVIARALAKDSPIILADEPTGNLDSATSAEIIELLREVSRDKLLIMVTHNFEQVEHCATRHIRVFDGAVESDHLMKENITAAPATVSPKEEAPSPSEEEVQKKRSHNVKNGITLGLSIFTSRPKLTSFLCFLMIIGTLGVFLITSFCGEAMSLFDKHYMFRHMDGRVVVARRDATPITDAELAELASTYGATRVVHQDYLLDRNLDNVEVVLSGSNGYADFVYLDGQCVLDANFDKLIGRAPAARNEMVLSVPIGYKTQLGEDLSKMGDLFVNDLSMKLVGVHYYVDNNIPAQFWVTEEGYRAIAANELVASSWNQSADVNYSLPALSEQQLSINFVPAFLDEPGTYYVDSTIYHQYADAHKGQNMDTQVALSVYVSRYSIIGESSRYGYGMYFGGYQETNISKVFGKDKMATQTPSAESMKRSPWNESYTHEDVYVDVELIAQMMEEEFFAKEYHQASLFFANDRAAHDVVKKLENSDYVAVASDTTFEPDAIDTIMNTIQGLMYLGLWIIAVVFFAFFINLCSTRSMGAFKGDMAIMRSMGISVKVIRIGMYVRMLVCLIPAYFVVAAVACLIYTTPAFNAKFSYLYPWQYVAIFLGMMLLTWRVVRRQIRKLFGESVRKSLKGGAEE